LAKRKEVGKSLDYISRQLGCLEIIEGLPEAGVKTDRIVNRGLDVLSASLNCLSVHIVQERSGIFSKLYSSLLANAVHRVCGVYFLRR
jgi:hypothetical protein